MIVATFYEGEVTTEPEEVSPGVVEPVKRYRRTKKIGEGVYYMASDVKREKVLLAAHADLLSLKPDAELIPEIVEEMKQTKVSPKPDV